jgi:hypothetical protein
MIRFISAFSFACLISTFLVAPGRAWDDPKEEEKQPVKKLADDYLILKAEFLEVDEAYYQKLMKSAKWRSLAEFAEEERKALDAPKEEKPEKGSSSEAEKPKRLLASKELSVNMGEDAVLLPMVKPVKCLPSPETVGKGLKTPQIFQEGVTLYTKATITPDRRYIRVSLTERSLEVEGTEKVQVIVGDTLKEATAEMVFVNESSTSHVRYIPDGGTILIPLQYRPRDVRAKDHWLVARVAPRIYIGAEERQRRAAEDK